MKHTFYSLLPLFLLLDLVNPFLLAPTYQGYSHTRQVMSVLGNRSAPFHTVYTLWLLFLGTAILLACAQLCPLLWGRSGGLSLALAAILIIYALGGCILSGLFPVSETKAMETLSAKIHGFGSVLGFLALTFAPLVVALFSPGVGILRAVRYGGQAPVCPHRDCMGGAVAAADPAVYVSSSGTALCQRRTIRKE